MKTLVWLLYCYYKCNSTLAVYSSWGTSRGMGGTVKIFKKCAPNGNFLYPTFLVQIGSFLGRVYVYMGKREFVSCDGVIEPINGVVNIQDHHDTLKGRRVYVQLVITFRHGREEEETMGLSFKKELILDRVQV